MKIPKRYTPFFYISPVIIVLAAITQVPFIYALYLSTLDINLAWRGAAGAPEQRFIGLGNYVNAFGDELFTTSLSNTALFIITMVPIELLLGLGLALLINTSCNRNLRGIGVIRTLLLLPMMVMPIVVGLTYRHIFNGTYGIMNWFIGLVGMDRVAWLDSPLTARISVVMVDVWQWTPFVMLIFLATLQALPIEPYEAARIDGASVTQTFRHITLPMLRSAFLIILPIRTMDMIKMFDVIYLLTKGGPGSATLVSSYYVFQQAFEFLNIGYASAMAMILLAIVIIISNVYIWIIRRR